MPDLISVFGKWWKFILGITLITGVVAYIVCLATPKEYMAVATSLPANSMTADRARLFNPNIEQLYSEVGTADELDKLEGTAVLDTIFIATADSHNLAKHYKMGDGGESGYKAAIKLKKNSKIARSPFGELKVKVWDEDRNMAASMANDLMARIERIHQNIQRRNNEIALEQINKAYREVQIPDTAGTGGAQINNTEAKGARLAELQRLKTQYEIALSSDPQVLLSVERARAPLWHDRPNIPLMVFISSAIALLGSFIIALVFGGKHES